MRTIVFFWLAYLLISSTGFSQSDKAERDSIRAQYIEDFPDHFAVWPHVKYRDLAFRVRDKDGDESTVKYNPNNNLKFGAGFYLFDVSFEFSFPVSFLPFRDESVYGESKATDLQINMLTKSFGLDLYLQKYSGFNKDIKDSDVPSGEPYPLRPDMDIKNLGGSAFYIWNKDKFSMRSGYNYADRQKKSAGSFILYGTVNSFTVKGDSAIISPSMQAGYGEGSDFTELKSLTIGLAPGYSYNLVIKRFFVNGLLAVGPGYHWVSAVSENDETGHDRVFKAVYTARIAAGYSGERFFAGASFGLQTRAFRYENIQIENMTSVFRLAVGYHFREKGFMKKRAVDVLKKGS